MQGDTTSSPPQCVGLCVRSSYHHHCSITWSPRYVCTCLNALFSLLCCGFKLFYNWTRPPMHPNPLSVPPYLMSCRTRTVLYVSLVRRRLAQEGEFLTFIYRAIRFDWMGASAAAAAATTTTTNDVPVRCDASWTNHFKTPPNKNMLSLTLSLSLSPSPSAHCCDDAIPMRSPAFLPAAAFTSFSRQRGLQTPRLI